MVVPPVTFTVGNGVTVTVVVAVFVHPSAVPVTVYVVVDVGFANGFAMFGLLRPVEGLQL